MWYKSTLPIALLTRFTYIQAPPTQKTFSFCTKNSNLSPTFAVRKKNNSMNAVAFVHEQLTTKKEMPAFKAGDNITVNYKIVEGSKERIQSFKGDVIKRQGVGATASFTVRKISDGVGVERLFPVYSPNIESITLNKVGKVRRARLFYLRERSGKSARIQEKRMAVAKKA
jgi:large subunit ribosomal protein L19